MLPKRCEAKYLKFFFNFQIAKDYCQKDSEAPGDEDEELDEEDGQDDTENGNKVGVSNISPETSGVKLKMKAEAPGDENEELVEEDGLEDTENGSKL